MEIINIQLAGNETKMYWRAGSAMELIAADNPITITFYDQGGAIDSAMQNVLPGVYMNTRFQGYQIQNTSPIPQLVQILVSDVGETGGSRRLPGTVEIVNSARRLATSHKLFARTIGVGAGASAGTFSGVQLWNNSQTMGVAISSITIIASDAAGYLHLGYMSTRMPNIELLSPVQSKRVDASAQYAITDLEFNRSKSLTTAGWNGMSQTGTFSQPIFQSLVAAGGQMVDIPLRSGPIVLAPNTGFGAAHFTAQAGFSIWVEGEVFTWTG